MSSFSGNLGACVGVSDSLTATTHSPSTNLLREPEARLSQIFLSGATMVRWCYSRCNTAPVSMRYQLVILATILSPPHEFSLIQSVDFVAFFTKLKVMLPLISGYLLTRIRGMSNLAMFRTQYSSLTFPLIDAIESLMPSHQRQIFIPAFLSLNLPVKMSCCAYTSESLRNVQDWFHCSLPDPLGELHN